MAVDTQNIERSIESTIKSISKKDDISCQFGDYDLCFNELNQSYFLGNRIHLPKVGSDLKVRYVGDMAALYLGYHSQITHGHYQFNDPRKQKLFDDFEKARLIILGSNKYLGIKVNFQNIIENEVDQILEIWDVPFLFIREFLSILNKIKIANFKGNILDKIKELGKIIKEQEIFAKVVADFIHEIDDKNHLLEEEKEEEKESSAGSKKSQAGDDNKDSLRQESEINNKQISQDNEVIKTKITDNTKQVITQGLGIFGGFESQDSEIKFVKEYKIFTKKYDQITKPLDLSSKSELKKLRKELDSKIQNLEKISHKLKSKLKRKLLSKKITFNECNKEEGFIDPKKLTKLVTSPLKKDNYLEIKENNYQDTIISFLIDNSGSMRGTPIVMSAMACELIAQILEKFSIKTEILGFTTSKWHGGKSKQLWQMSGGCKNPGRLSDLLHIIYKNSSQSLKKAKMNMALMLKEGILKENIDGEALLFAAKRLKMRPENRKILIIISDGAPIDDSTNSNNNKDILTNHLHHVISVLEKKSDIELAAIGIGHDVGSFYKNSIMIKNVEDLGDEMINKMCDLL